MTASSFSIVVLSAQQADAGFRLPPPYLVIVRDGDSLRIQGSDAAGFPFARVGDSFSVRMAANDWRALRDAIDKMLTKDDGR